VPARILIGVVLAALAATPGADARSRALRAFSSCPALVGYAQAHGSKAVGTGWVPPPAVGAPVLVPGRPIQAEGVAAPAPQTADGKTDTGAGTQFSTTNVQEEGVDEPDVVKTDGKVVYAVADAHLYAIDAQSDTPKLLGSLQLAEGSGHEILLHGNRVLVLQNAWLPEPLPEQPQPGGPPTAKPALAILRPYGRAVTRLTEVDVSDPSAMKVVSSERADGAYVSARRNGDTARVVVVSEPRVYLPIETVGAPTPAAAIRRRRNLVRHAKLASWRPVSYFRRGRQARGRIHPLVACQDVRHPEAFSGLDTVTVLTVDLSRGLPSIDSDAIMSDADIVYGSPKHLYVATRRWLSPQILQRAEPPPINTQINAFDVTDPQSTTYSGSGSVRGFLLNQFALSEQDGVLRVASTEGPEWWEGGPPPDSQSFVTTLDASSPTLSQMGQIGDLGKGQKIFAVRFIGDVGYVVTFRQLDPLYTVGLSDPAHPKVLGSLELAGYSAYLHPISKDLLLGVGQDASDSGRQQGTQLSLFDVSDPANPTRLARYQVGQNASSTAEFDHHAFLYWAPQKLAVIPVGIFGDDGSSFQGAIGFHVDRDAITEVGRFEHPAADGGYVSPIQRSLVVGSRLFTLSDAGLLSSDLGSLAAGPWLAFPDFSNAPPIAYAKPAQPGG
jgi:hypothetical protein